MLPIINLNNDNKRALERVLFFKELRKYRATEHRSHPVMGVNPIGVSASDSPVTRLGGLWVTIIFKRRQWAVSKAVGGIELLYLMTWES